MLANRQVLPKRLKEIKTDIDLVNTRNADGFDGDS